MKKSKEQLLIDRIEKAKQQLASLQQKRKLEIGELAYQCGIANFTDEELIEKFTNLAKPHDNNS